MIMCYQVGANFTDYTDFSPEWTLLKLVLQIFPWCTHSLCNLVSWPYCWSSSSCSFLPLSQHYILSIFFFKIQLLLPYTATCQKLQMTACKVLIFVIISWQQNVFFKPFMAFCSTFYIMTYLLAAGSFIADTPSWKEEAVHLFNIFIASSKASCSTYNNLVFFILLGCNAHFFQTDSEIWTESSQLKT